MHSFQLQLQEVMIEDNQLNDQTLWGTWACTQITNFGLVIMAPWLALADVIDSEIKSKNHLHAHVHLLENGGIHF